MTVTLNNEFCFRKWKTVSAERRGNEFSNYGGNFRACFLRWVAEPWRKSRWKSSDFLPPSKDLATLYVEGVEGSHGWQVLSTKYEVSSPFDVSINLNHSKISEDDNLLEARLRDVNQVGWRPASAFDSVAYFQGTLCWLIIVHSNLSL